MVETKLCKKCGKSPVEISRSTGYCLHCLETRKSANEKYNSLHRAENYERTKEWKQRNPNKVKEYIKRARENPARVLIQKITSKEWKQSESGKKSSKKYRNSHSQQLKEYGKLHRQNNKEKIKERKIAWENNNRDKVNGYAKKYRINHPEQVTKSSKNRRERFLDVIGTFTKSEWIDLCSRFENKCLWCKKELKLTIDHIVPISKGGSNFISNLQPLCKSCNSKKGTKILDFRPFGSTIMEWT